MAEPVDVVKENKINTAQIKNAKTTTSSKVSDIFLEIIAIIFWLYLFLKLFIFDVDIYLINHVNPHLIWLVQYKFFILISVLAIIWLFTKTKYIVLGILYIIFYPLILVLWNIPYFIFKKRSWPLLFAIINALLSFFKSIKYNFIISALFLLSLLLIFISHENIILGISVSIILVILIVSYIRTFIFVFKPSSIFQVYSFFAKRASDFSVNNLINKEIKDLETTSLNESQLQIWRNDLQSLVLLNRGLLFFSKKLKDFQDGKFNSISYVSDTFLLILLTVFSFAAINFGLYKIFPQIYSLATNAHFFIFLYYSFHTFLFGSINEVYPTGILSQVASMIEQVFAIFIVFILISLYFTTKNEKYKEELSETILKIQETGQAIEALVQTQYKMTFDQAYEEIGKMKANVLNLIIWFSSNIK